MARQMFFSLNPADWVAFLYNAGGNLHHGLDAAHSIATLHFLLRNNRMEEAKSWYRNWKSQIPRSELSHDQLMVLDDEYRVAYSTKQQLLNLVDGEQLGTLLVTVLGKLMAGGATEPEVKPEPVPSPETNHRPRTRAGVL